MVSIEVGHLTSARPAPLRSHLESQPHRPCGAELRVHAGMPDVLNVGLQTEPVRYVHSIGELDDGLASVRDISRQGFDATKRIAELRRSNRQANLMLMLMGRQRVHGPHTDVSIDGIDTAVGNTSAKEQIHTR